MFNIGIITDNNWDNFILIEKKLKKIDDEYFKIHSIYFKNIESIRRANNMTTLVIHNSNQLICCIQKMFEFVDLWLIFTNYVEYLTPCHYIMNKCFEYNLNFIIISEAFKNDDCINISNISEKNKVLSSLHLLG